MKEEEKWEKMFSSKNWDAPPQWWLVNYWKRSRFSHSISSREINWCCEYLRERALVNQMLNPVQFISSFSDDFIKLLHLEYIFNEKKVVDMNNCRKFSVKTKKKTSWIVDYCIKKYLMMYERTKSTHWVIQPVVHV